MAFSIPEYNERIIANPESRPQINLNLPKELSDTSHIDRMANKISNFQKEETEILLDMKKERDDGIVDEFMNIYNTDRIAKITELKEKYKGANAQGIVDEFKKWQDDYYTSHLGFSSANEDGTLYLENDEQIKSAREQLARNLPTEINSLSTYAATELENYRQNQFTARTQFAVDDLADERDVNNIAMGIGNIYSMVNEHYKGESEEYKRYVAGKLVNESLSVNVADMIATGETLDQLNLAEQMLKEGVVAKNLTNKTKATLSEKLREKQMKILGKMLANKGSGSGSGEGSGKASSFGAMVAYADANGVGPYLADFEEYLSTLPEPEQKKQKAKALATYNKEVDTINTTGVKNDQRAIDSDISVVFRNRHGGATNDERNNAAMAMTLASDDAKEGLDYYKYSLDTHEGTRENLLRVRKERQDKVRELNDNLMRAISESDNYDKIPQFWSMEQIGKLGDVLDVPVEALAVIDETLDEGLSAINLPEGATILDMGEYGKFSIDPNWKRNLKENIYDIASGIKYNAQTIAVPSEIIGYGIGHTVEWILSLFNDEHIVTKTKAAIEGEQKLASILDKNFTNIKDATDIINSIEDVELRDAAHLVFQEDCYVRNVYANMPNLKKAVDAFYNNSVGNTSKGKAGLSLFRKQMALNFDPTVRIQDDNVRMVVEKLGHDMVKKIANRETLESKVAWAYEDSKVSEKENTVLLFSTKEDKIRANLNDVCFDDYDLSNEDKDVLASLLVEGRINAAIFYLRGKENERINK